MKNFIKYQTFLLLASILLINTSFLFTSCKRNDPIDTTAPTNLSLATSEITQNSMKISVSAADNTAVASIKLYDNSTKSLVKTFTGNNGSFTLDGLTPNKDYSFYMTATDIAGNTAKSQVFIFKTLDETFTAAVDASTSFESSTTAVDKVLLGGSIAKAFVLNVTNAGTAKVEVLGSTTNGSPAVAYYWINGADNNDINVSCSTLNSKVAKTAITSQSFTINLQAGVNVICFKTARYSGKINNGGEVGLKMTFSNAVFKTIGYTADAVSANVAGIEKIKYVAIAGVSLPNVGEQDNSTWAQFQIFPYSDENATTYDGSLYPKILSYAVDPSNTNWINPSTNYSNLDFTNANGKNGIKYELIQTGSVIFTTNNANFSINNLQFKSLNGVQIVKSDMGNFAWLVLNVNVYNTGSQFGPSTICWYHKSIRFVGNPEIWIFDPNRNRIQ